MTFMRVDLHLHSSYSDGLLPPAEVVAAAAAAGLEVMALTDHDTAAGLPEALAAGPRHGIRVIPGVEFSADCGARECHVLGFGLSPEHPLIAARLREFREARTKRAERILTLLAEHGITLPAEKLHPPQGGVLGRMHVARLMVEAGAVNDLEEAFAKWLRHGRPAHVPHAPVKPVEIVRMIVAAGGLAVWAHPGFTGDDSLLQSLMAAGLGGLEAWHADHAPAQQTHYAKLAKRHGLFVTGGSDWHGDAHRNLPGSVAMPPECVEEFLHALAKNT